ncbi:MAG: hypothetical protein PWP51_2267 [Clostridiales bacterium]|nr:hypothetical protein [Clostridiales bacterium]MDN5299714.1 hypothetical protein [Clostridiales bacterium]
MNISKLPIQEKRSQDFIIENAHAIFDGIPRGVIVVDVNGRVWYANKKYCEFFGELQSHMIKDKLFNHRHDDLLLKSLKTGRSMEGYVNTQHAVYRVETSPIVNEQALEGIIAFYQTVDKSPVKMTPVQSDALSNPFPKIIGQNNRLIKELNVAHRVSKADVNILIRGESGTGKELVARSIHEYSERQIDRWVAINCAAIPENLIESELFGHEAGAFTGAIKRKIGKIEMAQGGTLFLDEIGDLPLQLQVKLLRVLQEREYCRVGGNEMLQMDTRIIAATHRNLEEMIENGQFREDLYYRLNIVEIHMLPLRERQDDIPLLIGYFAKQISEKYQLKSFYVDEEVIGLLSQHSWKGNIRELKNVLERSIILSDGVKLKLENLPTTVTQHYQSIPVKRQSQLINLTPQGELAPLEAYEKEIYCMAIEKYGSYNSAGKMLGVTHKTVAAKHRKFCDV